MTSSGRHAKIPFLFLLIGSVLAQSGKAPSVSMAPVGAVAAQRGKQTKVTLSFRVASGRIPDSYRAEDGSAH